MEHGGRERLGMRHLRARCGEAGGYAARIYEGRGAGADRDVDDPGVPLAQRAGRDDHGGGE